MGCSDVLPEVSGKKFRKAKVLHVADSRKRVGSEDSKRVEEGDRTSDEEDENGGDDPRLPAPWNDKAFGCRLVESDADFPKGIAQWPDFALATVAPDEAVFKAIARSMTQSLSGFEVLRIRRVWNRPVWHRFVARRATFGSVGAAKPKLLFHCCTRDVLQQIVGCTLQEGEGAGGFDPRLAAASCYSKCSCGWPFHKHAVAPIRLEPQLIDKSGAFTLVAAEVLCGKEFDFGAAVDQTLARPPMCPLTGGCFDSVTGTASHTGRTKMLLDSELNGGANALADEFGRMHVVYEPDLAYPHFVVSVREIALSWVEQPKACERLVRVVEVSSGSGEDTVRLQTPDVTPGPRSLVFLKSGGIGLCHVAEDSDRGIFKRVACTDQSDRVSFRCKTTGLLLTCGNMTMAQSALCGGAQVHCDYCGQNYYNSVPFCTHCGYGRCSSCGCYRQQNSHCHSCIQDDYYSDHETYQPVCTYEARNAQQGQEVPPQVSQLFNIDSETGAIRSSTGTVLVATILSLPPPE